MKTDCITIFFLSSFVTFLSRGGSLSDLRDEGINIRRILHQPLFPSTSPPPPSDPDMPDPANQPFFHQPPVGPTPDHSQHSLPTPVSDSIAAAQAHSPTKRVAIGITSGILTMALLSALAFYLYKRRSNHPDEAQKLFGLNPQRAQEESGMPPSSFLYIGTVNPSPTSVDSETNCRANGSPYRKLKPGKISERYRPSPDLQPLPPLPRALPPTVNSPPPMSSSDDESRGAGFYTSKNNHLPLSRKASSKSRMSAPPSIVPSIKQLPPPESSSLGPLQPSKTLAYTPSRAKHATPPPPPPPDMAKLRSISSDDQPTRKIPIPPPPPSIQRKFGSVGPNTPSPVVSKQVTRPESESPSPMSIPCVSSSEKCHREDNEGSKPKLKALHWDKVRATSEKATVWDQLKSSSFQLNEDAMESLFGCNSSISAPKESGTMTQENRVLDPKKSQNIAILIRALNVTREEVSEALLDGNPDGLGVELLETLVKMAPTKEEEIKLKDYNGDISRLGSAERFLKKILDVPFAFKRVEAMLYRANFDTEVAYLRNSFRTLEEASEELKSSRLFLKLLEAVLRTGNRMNDGTNRGDARAFKLNTLLKLVDVKGADGKTTLLHFVVQEIIRSEGSQTNFKQEEFRKQGLQVVLGLSKELSNIRKAAGMDSDVLTGYVSKLETGLEKVRLVTQYEGGKFSVSMKEFLREAVGEIARIKREERIVMSRVKELTEYFHGDAAKEEAHPLRIFLIVRDFLGILGNVCRDVGRMQDNGATMAVGRSFKMPTNKSRIEIVQFGLNDLFKE